MKTKRYFTFTVTIAVVSFVAPAIAGLSFYTDRDAWESAVNGSIVTENFDSVPFYELSEGVNSAGLIDIELVNLAVVDKWNEINDGSSYSSVNGTPYYQGGCRYTDPDTIIVLHLPFSASAFGGDFYSTYSSDGNGLMLQVNGLQYEFSDLMPFNDGTGFLGFVSSDAFSTVTLFDSSNNEVFGLDNVSFAVPEPATMVLLSVGTICLRKRRKI